MKTFLLAVKIAIYNLRVKLLATLLVCVSWIVVANFIENNLGKAVLDAIVYAMVGWYWLAQVAVPWAEKKLEKLF